MSIFMKPSGCRWSGVRAEGLEPTLLAEQGPKPCASASFATPAAKPSRYRPDDGRGHRSAVEGAPVGRGDLVDEVADGEHVTTRGAERRIHHRALDPRIHLQATAARQFVVGNPTAGEHDRVAR